MQGSTLLLTNAYPCGSQSGPAGGRQRLGMGQQLGRAAGHLWAGT